MKKPMRWLIIVLGGLLLAGTLGFSPPSQNSDEIELDIRAGYSGYFRPGKWLPVQVTVRNTGDDIRGFLQVRAQDVGDDTDMLYRTPITVSRNNPTRFIYVSLEDGRPEIAVELTDREGRVLESEVVKLNQLRARDILHAVITESDLGTIDVTGRQFGSGQIHQVDWLVRDLPDEAEALRALDVITIFDIGNRTFSDGQQEALAAWVNAGGHLIVHGGPRWQFAQNDLDALLPVDLQGIDTVTTLAPLGRFLGRPSDTLVAGEDEAFVITASTPRAGAETLVMVDDTPLVIRHTLGAGVVDYVAVDPLTAPLNAYPARDILWFELVISAPPLPSWSYGFEDWTSANNAVRIVTGYDLPSALQMLGFLGVYILLIGPANYLVLRQFKRLELAWFTMPVFIVIFTIIAYFTGFSLRGNAATVNHLAVVQVWPESEVAQVDGLVGVFSPRRTTYDLTIEGEMTLRTIPGIEDVDTGIAEVPVVQDAGYQIVELPVDAGIIASFATSGTVPAPPIEGQATWTLTASENVMLDVEFTNAMEEELQDAVVLAKDGFEFIGTLAPGETRTAKLAIGLQEPTWLPLGNRIDAAAATYRSFSGRRNRSTGGVLYDPLECSAGGYNATMAQIMFREDFNCAARGGTDSEREIRRRALLLTAINNEFDYSGGRGGDVYVAAWSEAAPFSARLRGTSQDNQYETLYIFKLPVRFQMDARFQRHVIPPGMMTWTLVDPDGYARDRTPYGVRLIASDQLQFRFMPVSALRTEPIDRLDLRIEISGNRRMIEFAVWDWKAGDWTVLALDFDQNMVSIEQPEPFLGPGNAVLVQITADESASDVFIELVEPVMYTR